jgi:DNA-binding MarR family transcriptional regulator
MGYPVADRDHPLDLEGVDPRSARVFGAFMRASRLHRQLMLHVLSQQGTPPGQAMCLRIVAAHDGATQRELGEMLHLSAPTVTAMLKRMERHGTITREADPEDQRIARVRLSTAGREQERRLRAILAERLGEVLDPMPEDDRGELARLLDDLAERMAAALEATATGAAAGAADGAAVAGTAR